MKWPHNKVALARYCSESSSQLPENQSYCCSEKWLSGSLKTLAGQEDPDKKFACKTPATEHNNDAPQPLGCGAPNIDLIAPTL